MSFQCSNNTDVIDVKIDKSVLDEKLTFKMIVWDRLPILN